MLNKFVETLNRAFVYHISLASGYVNNYYCVRSKKVVLVIARNPASAG